MKTTTGNEAFCNLIGSLVICCKLIAYTSRDNRTVKKVLETKQCLEQKRTSYSCLQLLLPTKIHENTRNNGLQVSNYFSSCLYNKTVIPLTLVVHDDS